MILIQIFAFIGCASFLSAQAVYWLWWFMGSPYVVDAGDLSQSTASEGRIFSFWGRFITKRYNALELAKYMQFIEKFPYNAETKQHEPTQQYQPTHLNFWKIAGCCIYCMTVWVAAGLAVFWGYLAVQNLDYNGGFFITFFAWFFYTFLTLFFVKKEFEQ